MSQSVNRVQSRISAARGGAIPNEIRVVYLPMRRKRRTNLSRDSGYFVVARGCGTFVSLMRLVQLVGSIDKQMIFPPTPMSR